MEEELDEFVKSITKARYLRNTLGVLLQFELDDLDSSLIDLQAIVQKAAQPIELIVNKAQTYSLVFHGQFLPYGYADFVNRLRQDPPISQEEKDALIGNAVGNAANMITPIAEITYLHCAVHFRHNDIVDLLVNNGYHLNFRDRNGNTPLHIAAKSDNMHAATVLLNAKANKNTPNFDGLTPLMVAIIYSRQVAELLIGKRGVDVKATADNGVSALHLSMLYGPIELFKTIAMSRGVDLLSKMNGGISVLMFAVAKNDWELVGALLETKKDSLFSAIDNDGNSTAHYITAFPAATPEQISSRDFIFLQCIKFGVPMDMRNTAGFTPLMWAVRLGRRTVVKYISTDMAVNLKTLDRYGMNSMMIACKLGDLEMLKTMLGNDEMYRKERLALYSKYDSTLLHIAVEHNHQNIVEYLLELGMGINILDEPYGTPLHVAIYFGNVEMARLLLERKANIEIRNSAKETPLHLAVARLNIDMIKLLVDFNAKLNVTLTPGTTALGIAVFSRNVEIAKVLVAAGATPHYPPIVNGKSIYVLVKESLDTGNDMLSGQGQLTNEMRETYKQMMATLDMAERSSVPRLEFLSRLALTAGNTADLSQIPPILLLSRDTEKKERESRELMAAYNEYNARLATSSRSLVSLTGVSNTPTRRVVPPTPKSKTTSSSSTTATSSSGASSSFSSSTPVPVSDDEEAQQEPSSFSTTATSSSTTSSSSASFSRSTKRTSVGDIDESEAKKQRKRAQICEILHACKKGNTAKVWGLLSETPDLVRVKTATGRSLADFTASHGHKSLAEIIKSF